ncbi:MAG: 2Fe-2S iron-sulfur cluster-binding protein, partial [Thermoguttaceae bacterium]
MDTNTIIAGIVAFPAIVLALVCVILVAQKLLVPSGNIHIEINDDADKTLNIPAGGKLLGTLANQGIFVPSACGGGGTCGQCKCKVLAGG